MFQKIKRLVTKRQGAAVHRVLLLKTLERTENVQL